MTLWPGPVLFLACLLTFDAATPLLPGAFRFDADESVDAVRPVAARAGLISPSPTDAPRPVAALPASTTTARPSHRRLLGAVAQHRPPRTTPSPGRGRSHSPPDDH